ncbi:PAS domain-containing protein [Pseudooctadecabacter jejudonensis]|uniref:PAS domain protein n=1 Tax=Pseudooctadecabacter jejudonensis TaxID=1391910 RepID=A0A1Y5RGU0_9RHOB|nr:PAS domain-containing protein [Pseudooctadecabacter jejudonensis]SLN15945.1 PAS domain protein [Pseudooctadecabacter jejudonensis]
MSMTFDPYKLGTKDVTSAEDVLLTNPTALTELETYWRSLPRSRGVPARADLDPVAMGRQLEDSLILERVAPGVARIRVAGRNIGKLIGLEPRGLPLTTVMTPNSRATLSEYIERAFNTPSVVELPLKSPRAVGQPPLQGKLLLLPLRDEDGDVTRMLGILVMSGRRGMGGRRFEISDLSPPRVEALSNLRAVNGGRRPSLRVAAVDGDTQKAKDTPALRLVVSNP